MAGAYPLFPILSFLGFLISLVPLPWHIKSMNAGTTFYMLWTSIACLNHFINALIWKGNVYMNAPAWCEICTSSRPRRSLCADIFSAFRIKIGAAVGIPLSTLCIMRQLYLITRIDYAMTTRAEVQVHRWLEVSLLIMKSQKRRAFLIDGLICGLGPLLFIVLRK